MKLLAPTFITLLLFAYAATRLHASPVIDDTALEEKFASGLTAPGVDGISGESAIAALAKAEGKKSEAAEAKTDAGTGYEQMCQSVVVVGSVDFCKECNKSHMGAVSTGWVVDPRGRIVTNYHVLEDKEAEELGIMTFDGAVYPVRAVVAADREGDAAIVEVDTGDTALPALPVAAGAKTGERIRVVGHPDGRFYSLTEGIVSRVFSQGTSDGKERRSWLTVTADYGGGSSGAPVLNDAGEVVGMVSSTATLLADPEDGKEPEAADVQMVFRDCVSVETMRRLLVE